MKSKLPNRMVSVFLISMALCAQTVLAQGTSFTYQGKLTDAGTPANGQYDFQFKLYDALTGGTQQGGTVTVAGAVTAGIFTVQLDFGACPTCFNGTARYLEIAAKKTTDSTYTTLSPRQSVTSTPYAMRSANATAADTAINATQFGGLAPSSFVQFSGNGNVGIGTTTPMAKLTVNGAGASNATGAARFDLFNTTAGSGFFQHVTDTGSWQIATTAGATRMVIDPSGNVGIGTASPAHRLSLIGGPPWTSDFWTGALELDSTAAIGWRANTFGQRFGIAQGARALFFFHTASDPGTTGSPSNLDLYIDNDGKVGIGLGPLGATTTKLNVVGNMALDPGTSPILYTSTTSGEQNRYLQLINSPSSPSASGLKTGGLLVSDSFGYANPGKNDLIVKGNVGLGTISPGFKLHIAGDNTQAGGFAIIKMQDTEANGHSYWLYSGANGVPGDLGIYDETAGGYRLYISGNGNIGIGTTAPSIGKLQVEGGSGYGVVGFSNGANVPGVYGANNTNGFGVFGNVSASGAIGVLGQATANQSVGVQGKVFADHTNGVEGIANGTSSVGVKGIGVGGNIGVFGTSGSSYAGYFDGNVFVTGTINAPTVSTKVDHPLDPANKYLSHSFVESPDMMNIYNGNVTTDDNGDATITLPDYFEALNRDFRYQLTVIGQFAQAIVATEIKNHAFTIKTDRSQVKVSWQVTGIRQDAYANANRIAVEEEKPEKERAYYLHPQLFGQPEERSIEWARDAEGMRRLKQQRVEAGSLPIKKEPTPR